MTKRRKRIIKVGFVLVAAYTLFACKKTTVKKQTASNSTTEPQKANTGGGGSPSGGGGSGIIEIFEYYGDNTGINVDFTSHSIISRPTNGVGIETGIGNSFCEYWVYDSNNNLKVYCKNTRSGLHPNYQNAFNSNNHLPNFSKRILPGNYRLVYKNISATGVNQTLLFGLITNNANEQINEVVSSGQTVERNITIYNSESSFKLNNNVYN